MLLHLLLSVMSINCLLAGTFENKFFPVSGRP